MQYLKVDIRKPEISQDVVRTEFFFMEDGLTPEMVSSHLIKKLNLKEVGGKEREQGFIQFMTQEDWDLESNCVGWKLTL